MTKNEGKTIILCVNCGCNGCIHSGNCPNRPYACEECTTSNPAWNTCVYRQKERSKHLSISDIAASSEQKLLTGG